MTGLLALLPVDGFPGAVYAAVVGSAGGLALIGLERRGRAPGDRPATH